MNSRPMVNPLIWHASIQKELELAAVKVLRSGSYVLGQEANQFEQDASDYLGCSYAISCANGTDALVLALTAADIGPGDEVITTPFTFFASTEAVLRVGATPVFVDIESETFNLNPCCLNEALSNKTRAVLAVHLFGLPARILEIKDFCRINDLVLIEDCAQSFGAEINKIKTGCFGDFGCFSFPPSENQEGYGGGGLVITKDSKYREKLLQLRKHGSTEKYQHKVVGYNSRRDELQVALLKIKLKHIDEYNRQRLDIACYYSEELAGCEVFLPVGNGHVFHQYTIQVDHRERLQRHLTEAGIASAIHYPRPVHHQPTFKNKSIYRSVDDLYCAEVASKNCLSLPIYPGMQKEQFQRVVSEVKSGLAVRHGMVAGV